MKSNLNFVVFVIGMLSFNSMLHASQLFSGNWLGTVEKHDRVAEFSTFVVEQSSSGEYSITMYFDERPYSFKNLLVENKALTFELFTGSNYSCQLSWDENNHFFDGQCTMTLNNETKTINIRMHAPEQIVEEPESPLVNND